MHGGEPVHAGQCTPEGLWAPSLGKVPCERGGRGERAVAVPLWPVPENPCRVALVGASVGCGGGCGLPPAKPQGCFLFARTRTLTPPPPPRAVDTEPALVSHRRSRR